MGCMYHDRIIGRGNQLNIHTMSRTSRTQRRIVLLARSSIGDSVVEKAANLRSAAHSSGYGFGNSIFCASVKRDRERF